MEHFECVKRLQRTGGSAINFDLMIQDQSTVQAELKTFMKKHEKNVTKEANEKEAKKAATKRKRATGAAKAKPAAKGRKGGGWAFGKGKGGYRRR